MAVRRLPTAEDPTVYVAERCIVCGRKSVLHLDPDKVARWQGGELIQNVWPEMPAPEREVLQTGIHPACWIELDEYYEQASERGEE